MTPLAALMFLQQTPYNLWKDRHLLKLGLACAAKAHPDPHQQAVVFVNISSRLTGLSQNAAFTLLSAMGLQLSGLPIIYFGCKGGLSRCVLGTNRDNHLQAPPCAKCIAQSERLFLHAPVEWFHFSRDKELETILQQLSLEELCRFEYPLSQPYSSLGSLPLGKLVLPSLRWALRRHHLLDDEPTRYLLCEMLLSAYALAKRFAEFLQQTEPQAAVIFNGVMYPEAVCAWTARRLGVRVITHEVGFIPFSAFFTDGEATAYPIHISESFELSSLQNQQLDEYLAQRFQGNFTMAGIKFWKDITDLDENFKQRMQQFKQMVPIFSNVIYDTSQIHANTIFPDMFAWLNALIEPIQRYPDTLFVIRAHPDEMRPGTRKQSRESVRAWVSEKNILSFPNVIFIDSQEYISSYQLIQHAKAVLVYNSSVGLEATLLGKAVLCAGRARYTQYPTVYFPQSQAEFNQLLEELLQSEENIVPPQFVQNARRFLYYQLYKVSLPFDTYLESGEKGGFVRLRSFKPEQLRAESSPTIKCILEGILERKPFELQGEEKTKAI